MAKQPRGIMFLILKKACGGLTLLLHSKVPIQYRYFIRDTYICKAIQLKYFWRDYVTKKKYKTISFEGEFGAELLFSVPHAYWHHINNTLNKTESLAFTKELYFFSETHFEDFKVRSNEGNYNFDLPRILFSNDYSIKKWTPPPLKRIYKNNIYLYEKPILIIANRYNMEWNGPPLSFFSIEMLDFMIEHLKSKFQIIYNRPRPKDIVNDNSDIYDLDEYGWLQEKHPEVKLMNDLFEENKIEARNFNHFQLCVYANCNHFISTHGGTATLASYFGGVNLIYSVEGVEHYFQCFSKLFPQLSGAKIYHASAEKELQDFITTVF